MTRAALVQAATFVELEDQGLVDAGDIEFALDQAETAYSELATLEGSSVPAIGVSVNHLSTFVDLSGDVLTSLGQGNAAAAEELIVGEMETAYRELSTALVDEQSVIQAAIAENTEAAARVNSYIVFILTLAIPGAAVVTYWWIARRQVREYRIKTEADLEAERAVSRAKDAFIAGLSHELRTPLTSIYGFAEILTESDQSTADQTPEVAQIIANEASELTRMVDDLLTAARIESTGVEIEMTPTRVMDVLSSAVAPFERAGAEIDRADCLDVVVADSARLRHVLVNLLSNAIRHGGPEVGIEVAAGDGKVDIEVWDNGPGVPDDKVERLFERFVNDGHESLLTGSIGLGLAVASRLTEMMGGELIHQRFAHKTYFIVRLAAHAPEDLEAGEDESVAEVIKAMAG